MGLKKAKLLEECIATMKKPHIQAWYDKNLKGKNQYYTLSTLNGAVNRQELTLREALDLAFIVGIQWNVDFEKEEV